MLALAVEGADAGRTVDLVGRKDKEIAVELADVDREVGHRLRAVDQDRHAAGVGELDHLAHRVDGAEGVGDVDHSDDLRALRQQPLVLLEDDVAVVVDRDHLEDRAALLAQQLPGDDVGVVLHGRDQDLVAGLEPRADKARGDQVDALGGRSGEDDLSAVGGADVALDRGPGPLEGDGRALRQQVDAAVDVRAVALVEGAHRIDHRPRFLGGGGVVEVDQRLAVRLLVEGREVGAHGLDVERPARWRSRLESSLGPLGIRNLGQQIGDDLLEAFAKLDHRDPLQDLAGEGQGQELDRLVAPMPRERR